MELLKTKNDLWEKYHQVCTIRNFSRNTVKDYKYYINAFLSFTKNRILEEYINPFILKLREKKYSTPTINLAISSIIFLFENVCEKKFANRPKKFRLDKKIPLIVSRENIIRMIQSTKNIKHKLVIEVLYSTGIRLSELIKIKKSEIDFDNGLIKIVQGKGRKDRYVIVSKHTIDLMKSYLKDREYQNNPYLFDSTETKHVSKGHPQQVLRRASKRLKLGYNVHPHSLRHSNATHLIEDGYAINLVQKNLGHSNPNTTQRYTQYANVDLTKIINPLDKQFEIMSRGLLDV